ncbi:MAG: L-threonylcarbamoyladenylate synthase [Alkalispirochaeta sp.]
MESCTSRSKPDSGRSRDTSRPRPTELLGPGDTAVAGELLRLGELVVIPTETVYGLAADATNSDAVQAIFAAKGRPQDNPLIVHLASVSAALEMIPEHLDAARRALVSFAPGPLTVVVPAPDGIAPVVRGGLDTVAFRVPAHPGAAAIIAAAGAPVAAPSANRSGRPSPTTFAMARWEMEGRVRAIVDGGDTDIGIESTVVDGTDPASLRILRPGSISAAELRDVVGVPVYGSGDADAGDAADATAGGAVKAVGPAGSGDTAQRGSPGTRYRHYQPAVPVQAFASDEWGVLYRTVLSEGPGGARVLLIAKLDRSSAGDGELDIVVMASPTEYARRLYREFRRAEEDGVRRLYVEIPQDAASAGLRDRILRAAQPADQN